MDIKRKIDHIVYAVPNLEKAILDIESKLGIKPSIGGRHLDKGTKNALMNLGNQCYLELIAIDHENTQIQSPRWMGVDYLQSPKITRWSLKSDNLAEDSEILKSINLENCKISGGSRKTPNDDTLSWEMILPTAYPEVDIIPFMTDWSSSDVHPTDSMREEVSLLGIELHHPHIDIVQSQIDKLDIDIKVKKDKEALIHITIKCPKGIVIL